MTAETWKDNKPTVNHIDGNPENNHVSNLEWATYEENNNHNLIRKKQDERVIVCIK